MQAKTPPPYDSAPASDKVAAQPTRGPRAPVLTAVLVVLALVVAIGGWLAYQSLSKPVVVEPDRAELVAIDAHLTEIQDGIRPIANALSSQVQTDSAGVIDVPAYRAQVAKVRDLVDATNDLAATSTEALEIRDLVLTGGSQVVAGMQETLNAMAADDVNAVTAAAAHVEEGLGNLQTARRRLDVLLGRLEST